MAEDKANKANDGSDKSDPKNDEDASKNEEEQASSDLENVASKKHKDIFVTEDDRFDVVVKYYSTDGRVFVDGIDDVSCVARGDAA